MRMLAHIMNNFDRPKDITTDNSGGGNEGNAVSSGKDARAFTSEYTSWTALSDLNRGQMHLRTCGGMNDTSFDINALSGLTAVTSIPLRTLDGMAMAGTGALLAAPAP